jgi:hypothetical protein
VVGARTHRISKAKEAMWICSNAFIKLTELAFMHACDLSFILAANMKEKIQHGQPRRELYTMLILRGALQSRARVLTTQDMQARDLQSRFGRRTVHLQRNDIMSLKCKWDVSRM